MKRISIWALLLAMILLVTGCAGSDIGKTEEEKAAEAQAAYEKGILTDTKKALQKHLKFPETSYVIGYVGTGEGAYEQLICQAISRSCYVMELDFRYSAGDADQQAFLVKSMLSDGVDALIWRPADAEGFTDTLKELDGAGIPYMLLDQLPDEEALEAVPTEFPYYETNIYAAGQQLGSEVREALGDTGSVKLEYEEETPQREAELLDGFADTAGEGISLERSTKAAAHIYAYGTDPADLEKVSAGTWDGILVPRAYELGMEAIKNIVRMLEGETVDTYRNVGWELYNGQDAQKQIEQIKEELLEIDCEAVWPRETKTNN